MPDVNPFATPEMALGYARSRPALHQPILERANLGPVHRALDIGCGAGLSTKPLTSIARQAIGLEPAAIMLRHAHVIAPGATFLAASAERLPVPDATFDLLTAAGSLNYTHLESFMKEAHRVLEPDGRLLAYDFATGRHPTVEKWLQQFLDRYPADRSNVLQLDPAKIAKAATGFKTINHETFELTLPLTRDAYLAYLLTNTNVASAVRRGEPLEDIRTWCDATLPDVHEITFPAYWITLARTI